MKKDNDLLIGAAVLFGGYFFVIKPLLTSLGVMKSDEEIKQEATNVQSVEAYYQQAITTQKPTKSEGEWVIIADTIYNALRYSALDDDKAAATYQIARVKNDADVALLLKAFGKRQEYAFGLPIGKPKSLQAFVRDNLSTAQINAINDNYFRKKIKFKF
jgi:hypothetical protein